MDPDIIGRIAERKIQEAIDEGKFDNLPGKGKPIIFEDDAATPAHLRMANKVLKNAGVLPDWMQVQKDIVSERQEIPRLLARLSKENRQRRSAVADKPAYHIEVAKFAAWHAKSRAEYLRRLKGVNDSILKFSLMAPSTAAPFFPYRLEAEMEAFDAAFPPLDVQPLVNAPSEAEKRQEQSRLKAVARERYETGKGGPIGGWNRAAANRRQASQPEPGMNAGSRDSEDIKRADVPEDMKK